MSDPMSRWVGLCDEARCSTSSICTEDPVASVERHRRFCDGSTLTVADVTEALAEFNAEVDRRPSTHLGMFRWTQR